MKVLASTTHENLVLLPTITQFPKHKTTKVMLSNRQILIRQISNTINTSETKDCKKCLNTLPITEFWFKDKPKNRRSNTCKDCSLEEQGIVEIGRVRFAKAIFKKGFRRCSVCKDIQPLDNFDKNNSKYSKGYSFNCKTCNKKLHDEYMTKLYIKRQQ